MLDKSNGLLSVLQQNCCGLIWTLHRSLIR